MALPSTAAANSHAVDGLGARQKPEAAPEAGSRGPTRVRCFLRGVADDRMLGIENVCMWQSSRVLPKPAGRCAQRSREARARRRSLLSESDPVTPNHGS